MSKLTREWVKEFIVDMTTGYRPLSRDAGKVGEALLQAWDALGEATTILDEIQAEYGLNASDQEAFERALEALPREGE